MGCGQRPCGADPSRSVQTDDRNGVELGCSQIIMNGAGTTGTWLQHLGACQMPTAPRSQIKPGGCGRVLVWVRTHPTR